MNGPIAEVRELTMNEAAHHEINLEWPTPPADGVVGDLEIRTIIRPDGASVGYVAANGKRYATSQITGAQEFIQELQGLRSWARAVLLKVVNVDGGDTAASEAIYNALRSASASGIPIVAFVGGWVASSAPWIALGADVVVMDPGATLALHSAEGIHPDPAVREQYRLSANAGILRILEERTIAPRRWLEGAIGGRWDAAAERYTGLHLSAELAFAAGFADLIGDEAAARMVARRLAGGEWLLTKRQVCPRSAPADTRGANGGARANNMYPNPTSETAPLEGQNPAAVEWANRYDAGASAYSGSHVRQLVSATGGGQYQEAPQVIVQCVPGERFYFEAQVSQRTAANAGTQGYIWARFYDAAGSPISVSPDPLDIRHLGSNAWTKFSVTTPAAPAGAVTVRFAYGIDCTAGVVVGETYWFDAMLARRVTQAGHLSLGDAWTNRNVVIALNLSYTTGGGWNVLQASLGNATVSQGSNTVTVSVSVPDAKIGASAQVVAYLVSTTVTTGSNATYTLQLESYSYNSGTGKEDITMRVLNSAGAQIAMPPPHGVAWEALVLLSGVVQF